jgi:hypothetical protein
MRILREERGGLTPVRAALQTVENVSDGDLPHPGLERTRPVETGKTFENP